MRGHINYCGRNFIPVSCLSILVNYMFLVCPKFCAQHPGLGNVQVRSSSSSRDTCCLSKRGGKHAGESFSFSSQAHPKDSEGSTVHFAGKTWWTFPSNALPNLHNCRVYGRGAILQEWKENKSREVLFCF